MENLTAVVLAGGRGTRMRSECPKVLHHLGDQPMIFHTIRNLENVGFKKIIVVVGHKADEVKIALKDFKNCQFVLQEQPLGTGDALRAALPGLDNKIENILVVNGDDSAFYTKTSLDEFIKTHLESEADVSLMTTKITTECELGRIIRDGHGQFEVLLEGSKYHESGLKSDEIVCGAYLFKVGWVKANISEVECSEVGEYYITSLINIAKETGANLQLYLLRDEKEWFGINTPEELESAQMLIGEH